MPIQKPKKPRPAKWFADFAKKQAKAHPGEPITCDILPQEADASRKARRMIGKGWTHVVSQRHLNPAFKVKGKGDEWTVWRIAYIPPSYDMPDDAMEVLFTRNELRVAREYFMARPSLDRKRIGKEAIRKQKGDSARIARRMLEIYSELYMEDPFAKKGDLDSATIENYNEECRAKDDRAAMRGVDSFRKYKRKHKAYLDQLIAHARKGNTT